MVDTAAAAVVPSATDIGGSAAVDTPAQPFHHTSGIVPQLQNVVSTVNLGCKLDLASIAQRARNAEYNPRRFAACIVRIKEPKTTALMFNSGKMVIAGAKSEELSRLAARKYTKILLKLGYQVAFQEFTVQNMVASCSVNFPIRLEGLAARFDVFCNYEPEVFPGLVFRMPNPAVVLLIFVTGKIVLTGAKKVNQIYEAFENVYSVLQEFRKGDARRIQRTPGTSLPPTPAAALTGGTAGLLEGSVPGDISLGIPNELLEEGGAPASAPATAGGSSSAVVLPQPTPSMASMPPPTPGNVIPAPTPARGLSVPPPTPAQSGLSVPATPAPGGGITIPPPTPAQGAFIPPPTPAQPSFIPPATPAPSSFLPPRTPGTALEAPGTARSGPPGTLPAPSPSTIPPPATVPAPTPSEGH